MSVFGLLKVVIARFKVTILYHPVIVSISLERFLHRFIGAKNNFLNRISRGFIEKKVMLNVFIALFDFPLSPFTALYTIYGVTSIDKLLGSLTTTSSRSLHVL
jgi:hypothetical protein